MLLGNNTSELESKSAKPTWRSWSAVDGTSEMQQMLLTDCRGGPRE